MFHVSSVIFSLHISVHVQEAQTCCINCPFLAQFRRTRAILPFEKGVIRTFFPYLHYINKSLNIQDGQRYRLLKTESCS